MLMFIDGEGLSCCSCFYFDFDMCRWYKLFDFGKCFFECGFRDVGYEDIGIFFCEQNGCFEFDVVVDFW